MAKTNPFLAFMGVDKKKAKIKALGDSEITYRELTLAEQDEFTKRIIKDFGKDGSEATVNLEEASKIKYEKLALVLIDPKMTVDELKSMHGKGASEAIAEILSLIEGDEDDSEEEGNEEK